MSNFLLAVAIFFAIVETISSYETVCKALCLSGGGDHGAYEVGVLKALTELNNTKYEVIVGTSIGAINAAIFGQYKLGLDKESAANLVSVWSKIQSKDLFENWIPGGIAEGAVMKQGLFNTDCAHKAFDRWVNQSMLQSSGRKIYFASTDLTDGSLKLFDQNFPDLFGALRASSAIAGLFPPSKIGENYYVDGFFSEQNTPVSTVIEECEKKYYKGVKIEVDVTTCLGKLVSPKIFEKMKTPFIFLRAVWNLFDDLIADDVQYARKQWPNAKIRFFQPSKPLPGIFLNFNHDEIMDMIERGYEDARSQILSGRF